MIPWLILSFLFRGASLGISHVQIHTSWGSEESACQLSQKMEQLLAPKKSQEKDMDFNGSRHSDGRQLGWLQSPILSRFENTK